MNQSAARLLAMGLAVGAGAPALAAEDSHFSANVAVTSDYRFRGVSQSAKDPALQGGVDYTHPTGLYLGAWGSTIDFGDDFDIDTSGTRTRMRVSRWICTPATSGAAPASIGI